MNRYQYLNGNGEHVHQLDGRPLVGTSRVGSILAKPLTWWASGLAVQTFGCLDPKVLTRIKNGKATSQEKTEHMSGLRIAHSLIKGMNDDQYAKLIDTAYRAHQVTLKDKAAGGTDLHAELERFVKDHMTWDIRVFGAEAVYEPQIRPFILWTEQNVKRFLWAEGHCYSETHWLGGISDAGYEKHDGTYGIIDFKSAKEAYFEHFAQIAGYDIQISENGVLDAEGNTIYTLEKPITEYAVFPFGGKDPAPAFNVDIEGRRKTFLAMLYIYNQMPKPD